MAARYRRDLTGETKVRFVSELGYQAGSWTHARRVVYKAEAMEQGTNTRFVVANRSDPPETLYDWYVGRGETENWMPSGRKDLKRACGPLELSWFLGQPVPFAAACRGLLAARHFAALAEREEDAAHAT